VATGARNKNRFRPGPFDAPLRRRILCAGRRQLLPCFHACNRIPTRPPGRRAASITVYALRHNKDSIWKLRNAVEMLQPEGRLPLVALLSKSTHRDFATAHGLLDVALNLCAASCPLPLLGTLSESPKESNSPSSSLARAWARKPLEALHLDSRSCRIAAPLTTA